ncbi:MAG TPA: hypothetical protein VIO87_05840 [Methylotenera sp.]|jgi:hypothetical protein
MKYIIYFYLAILQACFIQAAVAEESPSNNNEIPTLEQDFVSSINKFTKEQIIAQFGEPAKADDVKIKTTGKIVASIWQYHFINTAADGTYYETTELDFIDDKVVMVAFMNHNGDEGPESAQQYQVPAK